MFLCVSIVYTFKCFFINFAPDCPWPYGHPYEQRKNENTVPQDEDSSQKLLAVSGFSHFRKKS